MVFDICLSADSLLSGLTLPAAEAAGYREPRPAGLTPSWPGAVWVRIVYTYTRISKGYRAEEAGLL